MRPADLVQRSSFRLAMMLTLFILATLLLAGGIGFGLMHAQLTIRQDARVMEMFRSLELAMASGDELDLVEAVTSRIDASPDLSSLYLLKDQTGRILATNVQDVSPPPGWSVVPADLRGVTNNYPYRVYTATSGSYTLSVGLTDADLDDLREIMAGSLGWSALSVLVVAAGIAATLAIRMDSRLAGVDQTMNRVAQGDLAARLDLSGRGDDLDRIATTINAALARLEQVVEAMRQVSADIAHDLRTPLNRLRIRIEEAATKADNGQSVRDDLSAALSEADQINDTFTALLRVAQIESGSRKAGFRPLDIAVLLENVTDIYRAVAEDAGHTLIATPLVSVQINADRELLTQMFANLIENAIQHCPPGTKITCCVIESDCRVRVRVSDTGPGIPAPERENVLRRLYRLEKSRTTPGSGLGLSLVRAIADLHQAELILHDSDATEGTGLMVEIAFLPA